jgi:hypothetical protein
MIVVVMGRFKRLQIYTYFAFLILSVAIGVYFSGKYFYFSERRFVFPQVPVLQKLEKLAGNNRVWSFGPAYIDRNFLTYYHLQSPEGYDSIVIQRYIELLFASAKNGKYLPQSISRADAVLQSGETTSEVTQNPFRLKLLSLLGVKYIVGENSAHSDIPKDHSLLSPVWHDSHFIIYHYQKAYPRTFFVDTYKVAKNPQEIFTQLFSPATDLEKTLILEQSINLPSTATKLTAQATISSYSANKVAIQTASNKTALLFLSDNYYPGWQAFIDGKPTTIYRADYSFRSVIVPEGKHLVTFVYKPASLFWGALVSVISIVLLIIIAISLKKFRKV